MRKKYLIALTALMTAGTLVLGAAPMTYAKTKADTEADADEEDKKEEDSQTESTGAASTDPVSGIAQAGSYEDLYNMVREWNENPTYGNVNARVMTVEDAAVDVSGTASETASSEDMTATRTDENIDEAFSYDGSYESDHSSTNTQEEAVDEADIVKTDGIYIYSMDSKGNVRITDAASMKLAGEIHGERSADYKELYVDGDRLQIIRQQETYVTYQGKLALPATEEDGDSTVRSSYSMPVTTVSVDTYDISDREDPKKTDSYQQDGYYLTSRRNNGYLYLFTSYSPDTGSNADQIEYYVPRSDEEYIACDHIYLPTEPGGDFNYDGKAFLVAGAVEETDAGHATDIMAVVSGAQTFYVSEDNIYSAVSKWNDQETRTEIVRIGYEDGKFTGGAAGSVAGELNDNFSMDQEEENLRVVSTVEQWDKDYTNFSRSNSLYVLDKDLKTVGKIENLAEGEEIKSARFMGDTGYFVTYKNTDPLFAVDLSDPTDPKVTGELKITGFSEYLHFYGENKLLGIGWETDPDTGATEGMKCSMFDLSDPADIKETDRFVLKKVSFCDALSNYRAILASPQKNLFGFAYGIYGSAGDNYYADENYYYGLFSYSEEKGFEPGAYLNISDSELFDGSMSYQDYRTVRGVYIKDIFYLVSENGIASYDMTDGYSLMQTLSWNA